MSEDRPLFSRCSLGEAKSTASDWTLGDDSDGTSIWVHKPTGGAVKSTPDGWRYRIGSGEWSDPVANLGVAMDKAMGLEDGFEIM